MAESLKLLPLQPGKYVVAVSGGVDSMVLLDMLSRQPGLDLVVAHFEHGIRSDSDDDRKLVQRTVGQYGLPFTFVHGRLGAGVSEAKAREVRYAFLRQVQHEAGARAIITAHHQDDLIETAILNMLRGTGRRGLSALKSSDDDIVRPLLHVPKQELRSYAAAHHIVWHEDSTNHSDDYLRNYIRHHIVPALGPEGYQKLVTLIQKAVDTNPEIDELVAGDIKRHTHSGGLDRAWFILLPHAVAREVMASWLRQQGVGDFDRRTIERLVVAAKTYHAGHTADVNSGVRLETDKKYLRLVGGFSS